MNKEETIVAVEFHRADGTSFHLSGEDFREWNRRVSGAYAFQQIRSGVTAKPFAFVEGPYNEPKDTTNEH